MWTCFSWPQRGLVLRTIENYILWNLCSYGALRPTYEDLSHKVYSEVGKLRRSFGIPPAHHHDLTGWSWSAYDQDKYWRWSPLQDGGAPLKPPECWMF